MHGVRLLRAVTRSPGPPTALLEPSRGACKLVAEGELHSRVTVLAGVDLNAPDAQRGEPLGERAVVAEAVGDVTQIVRVTVAELNDRRAVLAGREPPASVACARIAPQRLRSTTQLWRIVELGAVSFEAGAHEARGGRRFGLAPARRDCPQRRALAERERQCDPSWCAAVAHRSSPVATDGVGAGSGRAAQAG